ncbi:MAG: S-adenosylhomocysteine/5'-methylthioadenosine nucleosidase [Rhodospirillaceae bacterium]|nr:MAG: S-adenosylhomocysteine/5'-methylthioadenosine nucleosidase [Rhodospirillaceae bacterium]
MIGIVTGLAAEARCCDGRFVRCEGPGAERAARACEILLGHGVGGLVSFGLAGGLAPALRPGAVVLASEVVLEDGRRMLPHGAWRERLRERLAVFGPVETPLAVSTQVVTCATAKADLTKTTGAGAVDMESGAIALCATAGGVPFVVVRVTADPAERTLPPVAEAGVDANGRLRPLRLFQALARHPGQGGALFRLAQDSRTAFARLRRVAERAGADFAFL